MPRLPLEQTVSKRWYDHEGSLTSRLLLGCLAPASWAYGAASKARSSAYDRGWLSVERATIPVVSVGNLVAGGAGKTPVVIELARRLAGRGHKVAVVSRGYKAAVNRPRIVSEGEGPILGADEAGDEPFLVARSCPGTVVLAGPDRAPLVGLAATEFGSTVAILDDGLQHRRLHRNLEVVVVDSSAPVGNGRLLPRGPLREPIGGVDRADLLWMTRTDEAPLLPFNSRSRLDDIMARAGCPVVRSRYDVEGFTNQSGVPIGGPNILEGKRALALSGIARPSSFVEALSRAGARVVSEHVFPDHHRFSLQEISRVMGEAALLNACVVTTEKDAVRIPATVGEVLVLKVRSELVQGEDVLEGLLDRLTADGPGVAASGAATERKT